ncbi:MAG: ParB N-terminal domain-containing protein [Spirochaetaceae bacterium]|jgi:ParB family chromosome partitioning protein|nr:ParB N-terminal domain-containing protein [Spirochaetaceae bacterium]
MQIPVEDIIVKKRIRQDMGDIPALAESMKRFGLLSPLVINERNELIAGGRRLEAARYLGWKTINVVVLDIPEKLAKLEYEIEENIQRQNFSPDEIIRATKELNQMRNPGLFRRILRALVQFFRGLFRSLKA